MKKIVIGICSIGSGVGQSIVDSCQFFRDKITLIGLGNNPLAYGAFECDDYTLISSYYDRNYISELKSAVENFNINILIPGHDDEALLLAKNYETLSNLGIKILSSPYELVLMCRNKATYTESFYEAANFFVKTYQAKEIKDTLLPLIAKPEQGFASKGVAIITTKKELKKTALQPGYIYQEIAIPQKHDPSYNAFIEHLKKGNNLQASEISLQLIFDKSSDLVEQCATYNTLKDGIPIEIQPYPIQELSEFIDKISLSLKRLKAFGPINIQGRMTIQGFKAFEINPRFTGITGLRAKLGFNEVEFCIFTLLHNERIKPLVLSDKYIGIRQVANKKVQKARVKPIQKENFYKKNILLTGSRGMIGSHLLAQLSNQGHKVSLLHTQNKFTKDDKDAYTIKDLRLRKINFSNFDTIIHLGFARPNSTENDIHDSIANSFELATQAVQGSVDHFIFASSQSVYGFSEDEIFTEESETNPQNSYARAKITVEDHIRSITQISNDTNFTILRLASVIAPFDENFTHEAYSLMISKLLKDESITISTPNRLISKIDFNDALDAIAYFTNIASNSVYDVVNIASAKNLTLLETMKTVAKELEKPETAIFIDPIKDKKINNLVSSTEKAKQEYGWESKIDINRTAKYFKKHFGC
ncbi:MAG: nucleoside-diphosphate-sugar epimerase [Halomonas sp. HL-48]|nr:NAD-dependent epimerase/dehydratase family protein [Halomonas sp. HL-48]KPQ23109.1 MAG: nucleoside-diphosphate-sugar epimerase [Halomonas sp. HL-48]